MISLRAASRAGSNLMRGGVPRASENSAPDVPFSPFSILREQLSIIEANSEMLLRGAMVMDGGWVE